MKYRVFKSIILFSMIVLICNGCNRVEDEQQKEPEKVVDKKVNVIDTSSGLRPVAVMINNHKAARPHSGLDDAFIVYEIMVEGGITRMMALYEQSADEMKIGSVRSARHNYLDYVMENDAIFVHWGDSVYANDDMKKYNIDHIDGMVYGNIYFTTDSSLNRSVEHTRFTSSSMIKDAIDKLGIKKTTNLKPLLNYTTDEVDLSQIEGSKAANSVAIKYSGYETSEFEYNDTEKLYYHSMSGDKHIDLLTNNQYSFKNIIAYSVKYNTISDYGHQDMENVGSGEGVYITNGYSVPIKWEKKSRKDKTLYTYLDGKEIDVSDGKTFIQIYPTTGNMVIE